jgi:hypothetical protein
MAQLRKNESGNNRCEKLLPRAVASFVILLLAQLSLGFVFLPNAIEDSVDEVDGLRGTEFPGNFESFIDHDCRWGLGFIQQLVAADPQNIPIYRGHSRNPPVLRMPGEQYVYTLNSFNGPFN